MLGNTYNLAVGQTLGVEIQRDTIGGPQCPVKRPLLQSLRETQAEEAALTAFRSVRGMPSFLLACQFRCTCFGTADLQSCSVQLIQHRTKLFCAADTADTTPAILH